MQIGLANTTKASPGGLKKRTSRSILEFHVFRPGCQEKTGRPSIRGKPQRWVLIQSISSVLGNITKINTCQTLMNKIAWSETWMLVKDIKMPSTYILEKKKISLSFFKNQTSYPWYNYKITRTSINKKGNFPLKWRGTLWSV